MTNILLVATMDTKGQEALYLRDRLAELGAEPRIMDLSMRRGDADAVFDIPAASVAEAGGSTLEAVAGSRDMTANMAVMDRGAALLARTLVDERGVDAVIGVGGCTGALLVSTIMQALPFGLPKVMISSAAAQPGLANQFLKTSDIVLFHSVVEIAGLSDPVRNVLDRAARCVWAMACGPVTAPIFDRRKAIAMTMMSPCERTAKYVRVALEREGYQVIGFHANGIGDRAMEEMIAAGLFQGVIDLAPGAVGEHVGGYMRDAGPSRLESAGQRGIPQIVSTCGVNHITPSRSRTPGELWSRRRFDLDTFRTWVRMTPYELEQVSEIFADKLNRSKGPVRVMVPRRGWSSVDSPGSPTYSPYEDALFVIGFRSIVKKEIEIVEIEANMEDPRFARAVAESAIEVFHRWESGQDHL